MSSQPEHVTGIVSPVADGITLLDLQFLGVPGVIGAYLVACGDSLLLVETGPTPSLPALEAALEASGRSLDDLTHILVTHIHLDHSGAAGVIARGRPELTVLVHPAGTPHLIDPERLVRSAGRIYGDDMDRLWGEIAGVPEAQVASLEDDQTLTIGDRSFRVVFVAGHAGHHMAVLDQRTGTLFTGDTGGVRVPGTSYVAAPIPPPEFDPDAWLVSLGRMRALNPARLALTHFGAYDDVETHLAQLPPRFARLVAIGVDAGEELPDTEAMTEEVGAFQRELLGDQGTPEVLQQLELANPDKLAALGLQRYLRKRSS